MTVDFPQPDAAGHNIDLRPEFAPRWLSPLVSDVTNGVICDRLRRVLAPPQRTETTKQAAVLMLLAGDPLAHTVPNDATVLLTHRSPTMRSHSGQIAFPGGRMDPTDHNVVDCALREAWEETGVDRMSVTPLVTFPMLHIRATGYPVHPVLGYWHKPSRVGVVSPNEADSVAAIPIAELADPSNRLTVEFDRWSGPAFRINDFIIWGFTGGLLDAMLYQAGWEQPWDSHKHYDLYDTLARSRNNERLT
ncbi:NUDIX hydrolase [Corynebacterium diphtheriae]|uniref:NUDIX hydrolase n=1 Tax=Corynebacterium diphtheriae TaxID=1717 RepID=UPI0002601DBB|nr:CoA pyrophosphatase [Corynebacterium diphtheriae]EIK57078.1 hypothetical protein W5M_01312 [Corynebacterium diphtheriae bv. intermedius str. NCTC 5011]OWM40271.1 coenzyme A pyrophosphatase [Corynebacterium diphtheriae bv. intermedius]